MYIGKPAMRTSGAADATAEFAIATTAAAMRRRDGIINSSSFSRRHYSSDAIAENWLTDSTAESRFPHR
jgi:hypothetical protein